MGDLLDEEEPVEEIGTEWGSNWKLDQRRRGFGLFFSNEQALPVRIRL